MHAEISIRPDFIDAIERNKVKLQNRGNDDDRYRRLLRELARVNISIRYTLPRVYTSEEERGKRSLKR